MTSDSIAREADRGRQADAPSAIPKKGWKDIAVRVKDSLRDDQVSLLAAGVAFFTLLALAPALAAVVSIYGLVTTPAEASRQIADFTTALPKDARSLLADQVKTVAGGNPRGLGIALVIGVLLSLWTASGGMKQLIEAVNVAYDESETRKFLRLRGLALLFTLGMIVVFVATLGLLAVLPAVVNSSAGQVVANVVRWPLLAVLTAAALAVLYRYAPDRDNPKLRWVTWGAGIATLLWVVGSVLFTIYVSNFGHYNKTYGSLGAVVVLLLWLYLSAFIILLGAEINAEMELQTAKDTTKGPEQPMGTRQAYAADKLGPASDKS
ncbi:MAG: YihY/virulence factor BrkB family protein [Mycobacteriales bacterium]